MPFTASTGQQAALPVQTTPQSSTVTNTGLRINGGSIGPSPVQTATADEITFIGQKSGTIQSDSLVEVQVSNNGTNYGVVYTFTNAQIQNALGFAAVVKVGIGNFFRIQFIAGTTTGGGNGIQVRFKN